MCHELHENHQQTSEHAVKSHTNRINLGVHGASKPQLERPVESVKVPEFEVDFCFLLQDPKRRHQPGGQVWATTLVLVDVTAQNPMSGALSTKSDENAYLPALCTPFVKRMANVKTVLRVDPEVALEAGGGTSSRLRASADGIHLKVQTAPRFSSQSIGPAGRAQDAVA